MKNKFNLVSIIGLVIIWNFHFCASEKVANPVFLLPSIKILEGENSTWRSTTVENTTAYYSVEGSPLKLTCSAPYPIKWKLTGFIAQPDLIQMQQPNILNDRKTFRISLDVDSTRARNRSDLRLSAEFICEQVKNDNIRNSVFIFQTGNQGTLATFEQTVTNSYLIPCVSLDPTMTTDLYHVGSSIFDARTAVENIVYNPTEGFRSEEMFNGSYACKQTNSFATINATISTSNFTRGYNYFPSFSNAEKSYSEIIVLKCQSNKWPVKIEMKPNKYMSISFINQQEKLQEVEITLLSTQMHAAGETVTKAACISSENGTLTVVKKWKVIFRNPITLSAVGDLSYGGRLNCIYSPSRKVFMQSVNCDTANECELRRRCFKPEVGSTNCGSIETNYDTLPNGTRQFKWKDEINKSHVKYVYPNGIAICEEEDGVAQIHEYFTALSYGLYTYWRDAAVDELIRISQRGPIIPVNTSSTFTCTSLVYFFHENITFEIEYQNGTRQTLLGSSGDKPSFYIFSSTDLNNNLKMTRTLTVELPIETTGVHCHAYWWNSTDIVTASARFRATYLLSPILQKGNEATEIKFEVNATNSRLVCNASNGYPEPVFRWLKEQDGKFVDVHEVHPFLINATDNGTSYLEFPNVHKNHSGNYKCVAENNFGKDEMEFVLKVTEKSVIDEISREVVIIGSAAMAAIIISLVALISLLWKKYRNAKNLMRPLTNNEITEFWEGKPKLLRRSKIGGVNTMETIDFLPYNMEYEIDFDDLEFDKTAANFLGSGQFSYVVKGKIVSRSMEVALKITKETVDVNLFKSLLLEVKIMIYVGHHENIVTMVGVCTENIRNRSLYIATEICELGNLERFLCDIETTAAFIDLIDKSNQIDPSIMPTDLGNRITTLNLINFSYQIAVGMEYLASKSILHADLAARNVLLTSERRCKISDFGLSRKLYSHNYEKKSKTPIPWRWMSPESLTKMIYSTQSDIWSFGVTLYEIFSLGRKPFPNENFNNNFITNLDNGMRMEKPRYCTQEIYSIMTNCWQLSPEKRPAFGTLRSVFEEMQKKYEEKIPNMGYTTLLDK